MRIPVRANIAIVSLEKNTTISLVRALDQHIRQSYVFVMPGTEMVTTGEAVAVEEVTVSVFSLVELLMRSWRAVFTPDSMPALTFSSTSILALILSSLTSSLRPSACGVCWPWPWPWPSAGDESHDLYPEFSRFLEMKPMIFSDWTASLRILKY